MNIISRDSYFRARKRHRLLRACFYAFILAQMSYGWLLVWASGDLLLWLLKAGNLASAALGDVIPAINNVVRAYHADGYGARALLGGRVAAVGWLLALAGLVVFAPLLAADAKFLKRIRTRRGGRKLGTSGRYLAWSLVVFPITIVLTALAFNGWLYNGDGGGRGAFLFEPREYNFAAGVMTAAPFVLVMWTLMALIHACYAIRLDYLLHSQNARRERRKNES